MTEMTEQQKAIHFETFEHIHEVHKRLNIIATALHNYLGW